MRWGPPPQDTAHPPATSWSATGQRGPFPEASSGPLRTQCWGCFLQPRATAVILTLEVGVQWKQSLSNLKPGWTKPRVNQGLSEGLGREHLFTQFSQEGTQLAPLNFTPV